MFSLSTDCWLTAMLSSNAITIYCFKDCRLISEPKRFALDRPIPGPESGLEGIGSRAAFTKRHIASKPAYGSPDSRAFSELALGLPKGMLDAPIRN